MANEKSDNSSKGLIQRVEGTSPVMARDDMARAVATFSPLGVVAEAYANTLMYRIESKRLRIELERVNAEYKLRDSAIDKTFRMKMEELDQRRLMLNRYFDTVQQQLRQLHIERVQVLKMVDTAMKKTLEPGLPLDERRLYKEMVTELTDSLTKFAERANEQLGTLVKALPMIEMPRALLSE
jgi:hypothetical protein